MSSPILAALRRHAVVTPELPALQGDRSVLDFKTLLHQVDALSAWFRAHEVRRAALQGDNSPEWLVADLAAWQAGVVLVPIPPFFSRTQREHVLDAAAIEHVISTGGTEAPASGRPLSTPVDGVRVTRIGGKADTVPVPDGTCKVTFTSGTTGEPKGVCLDGAMLDAVTAALSERFHSAPEMSETLRTHFVLLPLATLLENVAGAYVPLLLGKRIVVRGEGQTGLLGSSRLDLPRLLQTLHRDQPDSLIVLPQILRGLVMAAEQGMPPPTSLRFIAVGGATTPPLLIHRARALGLPVHEGYGLSECGSVVALNAPGGDRVGSVGRVLSHVRVRVVADVIQVAGNGFPGYLGQPAAGRDEWLDTGDIGHLDDDGFLHVTGRRKHLLITAFGRNVSPEWVEAELALDPRIGQVMVVGEAQPFLGAVVVPAAGVTAEAVASVIAHVNAGLPDYARVRRFLLTTEPFTAANELLTDNGRLRRDAIARRHAAGLAALFQHSSDQPPELAHDVL